MVLAVYFLFSVACFFTVHEHSFQEYDIWIRNVITSPRLSDHREWTFWQYTDHGKLEGYQGNEKYIDMNVFNGSREDFLKYP